MSAYLTIHRVRDPISAEDVRNILEWEIERKGSQKAVAEAAGVSPMFVCYVLRGRRAPTGDLLAYLGLEAVTVYKKAPRKPANVVAHVYGGKRK